MLDERNCGEIVTLRRLREQCGLTRAALAGRVRIPARTLRTWEEEGIPNRAELVRLLPYFGVDLSEVAEGGRRGR